MKYRFKPTRRFWKSFYALPASQKDSTRRAWAIFKENPFDPRLRPHKIQRLSCHYGCTIYAADIEGDLRAVFYVEGDIVVSCANSTRENAGCHFQNRSKPLGAITQPHSGAAKVP